ncbi:hypothetical protein WN55_09206, partial [Dufourea novaeangliae]
LSFTRTRANADLSLSYGHAASGDNDKGDQAVITRTAELNTCGVVNSPFSRGGIDRSINLRAPVAIRRPVVHRNRQYVERITSCPIPTG